ncbi:hypothetical protein TgHK011_010082 [Trichoderma gracile]|nr:hypothetical protein TgHK011_010082 [Trichoderma gracile]
MSDQANQEKGGKGKEREIVPPAEADLTETTLEHPAVTQDGQENPTQENAVAEGSVAEASSSSEGAAAAGEVTEGPEALKPWQQRALRNGRTPLPESRPLTAEEAAASSSSAQPTRRAPRPRWRIADIRRVLALGRAGVSYSDIQKYTHRDMDQYPEDHEEEVEIEDEGDEKSEDDNVQEDDEDGENDEDDDDDEDEIAGEEVALD